MVLSKLDLSLKRGTVIGVVGAVGTGKSTLLAAMVGELEPAKGTVESERSIAFVSQRPFVVACTVRENIEMGRAPNAELMSRVLSDSEFVHDLQLLPSGLDTEIGERGTTLSGGQQQRLCIARALFTEAHLLIMDDPLAAVDPLVGNKIFATAVKGHVARGGSAVITLSHLHLLAECDSIVHLCNGKVEEQGSHKELMAAGGECVGKH